MSVAGCPKSCSNRAHNLGSTMSAPMGNRPKRREAAAVYPKRTRRRTPPPQGQDPIEQVARPASPDQRVVARQRKLGEALSEGADECSQPPSTEETPGRDGLPDEISAVELAESAGGQSIPSKGPPLGG